MSHIMDSAAATNSGPFATAMAVPKDTTIARSSEVDGAAAQHAQSNINTASPPTPKDVQRAKVDVAQQSWHEAVGLLAVVFWQVYAALAIWRWLFNTPEYVYV